ncbi:PadR family transcriptional regulator [Inconstantimicrobium mannanitabidum]|uniref:PadR family transcriptional regulator n=1 Tax=Inconstantimicrobium mannanitabidum TaxID=1604901 RepID=A0ACB5RFY2_9CLOT|nr:PadR family transcriptional regulator [Clostridium sp. TW13]GKX67959.1 PadR family transcriptional regulator [Clostridium sp. TW13]
MEFDKEILKGYIDSIVLSVLYDEDMYGYLIVKKIKEKSNDEFNIKEATLYVSLKRLEKKGYLQGYWNDTEGTSGGRRRYYSITKEGKECFDRSVEEWNEFKKTLNNFMRGN